MARSMHERAAFGFLRRTAETLGKKHLSLPCSYSLATLKKSLLHADRKELD